MIIDDHEMEEICNDAETRGYNKAIDYFEEKIQWEYLNGCGIKQIEKDFFVAVSSKVAEQLNVGGENEI